MSGDAPKPLKQTYSDGAVDLLRSAAYSAVQSPLDGIAQIAGKVTGREIAAPHIVARPKSESLWTSAGHVIGSVAQFAVAARLTRKALIGAGVVSPAASISLFEMAGTGAAVELLNPIDPKTENFFLEKGRRAVVSFGTFAAMGGANNAFHEAGSWGRFGNRSLSNSIKVNSIAGAAGGLVHTQLDAVTQGKLHASPDQYLNTMFQYAAFGALFGAGESLIYRPTIELKSPAGTARGATKAPSSEEFVSKLTGKQPLESELLSWLADNRPELRPPNYADWKQAQSRATSANGTHRELGLADWKPEQRVQIVQELRKLAGTQMSSDSNIDAFIGRVALRSEVAAYQNNSFGPVRMEALGRWSRSSADLRQLVQSDMTLWESRWSKILGDAELHAQRPDVKALAEQVIKAEKDYYAAAQLELDASGVRGALADALNAVSRESGWPILKRGFKIPINEQGGGYGLNYMELGEGRVLAGGGQLAEAGIHELRHHEWGKTMLVDSWRRADPPTGPAYYLRRGEVELQLLERNGGTYDFLKRLSDPESVSSSVFSRRSAAGEEVHRYAEYVRKGEVDTARWRETEIKATIRSYLEDHVKFMAQENRRQHQRYVGSPMEVPAWSMGMLARIRAQALGLPDVARPELPYLLEASTLLPKAK